MKKAAKRVQVVGDLTREHNIYKGARLTPDAAGFNGTTQISATAGAELLHDILSSISNVASETDETIFNATVERGYTQDLITSIPANLTGYSIWEPAPRIADDNTDVWRMTRHLGYGASENQWIRYKALENVAEQKAPDILVIEDSGLGFRFKYARDAWPDCILQKGLNSPKWIIVNMRGPVASGDLWYALQEGLSAKLIVILSVEDLRQEEILITKGISWERSAIDLVHELRTNPILAGLRQCRHLIVSFGSAGALYVDNPKSSRQKDFLIFDPAHMEGEWQDRLTGTVMGNHACLAAGIISEVALQIKSPALLDGIQAGLAAMRRLLISGHGKASKVPAFPITELAREIITPSWRYRTTLVPSEPKPVKQSPDSWAIISTNPVSGSRSQHPLFGVARQVALKGPCALRALPFASFGKLFTTDRFEIESLRNLKLLIAQYCKNNDGKKPLSLAVFGPPGAGKSFSIKQIAGSIMGENQAVLEFNLSQFAGTPDLIGAFHQVRDKVLEGLVPLVFWDEFDSQSFKWLQYLLAPMQDGKFQEGQITHPIGKCIFVFAGGTSHRMQDFGPADDDVKEYKQFKMLKGPDFVSRLNGYLNVLGPNRRRIKSAGGRSGTKPETDDPTDICFPIRRSLILRVALKLKDGQEMQIDSGMLTALLEVKRYEHGARSLQTILTQMRQPGRTEIRRSDLPPKKSLSLHVDPVQFIKLVNRDVQFMIRAEVLAKEIHANYLKHLQHNDLEINPEIDKPFDELSENFKRANIAAASRIPQVLALVGLFVVRKDAPGSDNPTAGEIQNILEDNIDLLAEAEHELWVKERRRNGWRPGNNSSNTNLTRTSIKSYEVLDETDKNKDRNQVRGYPGIVNQAAYKIATTVKWD